MWANRSLESSEAFLASFGRTKHCGTESIATTLEFSTRYSATNNKEVSTVPQYLVATVVLAAGYQHLGELGVQRKLGHDGAQLGQVPVIVQPCSAVLYIP